MCDILSVLYFIAALFTCGDFNKFITLSIVAALFSIAGNIWSLRNVIEDKNK